MSTMQNSKERFEFTSFSLEKNLDRVLASGEVDDFKSVLDDTNGHELFTVVATVHHQRVDKSLDDWALSLAETLNLVATTSVWKELIIGFSAI